MVRIQNQFNSFGLLVCEAKAGEQESCKNVKEGCGAIVVVKLMCVTWWEESIEDDTRPLYFCDVRLSSFRVRYDECNWWLLASVLKWELMSMCEWVLICVRSFGRFVLQLLLRDDLNRLKSVFYIYFIYYLDISHSINFYI